MLLYDSDNPDDIPDGVAAAGYVDGYAAAAWNARGWARFPGALRIAVFSSTNDGHVLDVENFDATPGEAPGWVLRRRAAGVLRPWVYCNRSNRGAVERALIAAGVLSDQVALWVATLDGTQLVPAGPYPVAAVQYANSTISGGHYDLSTVNGLFGPGAGALGADDMTPEQDAKLTEILAELRGTGRFANIDRIAAALGIGSPDTADPATIATTAQVSQAVSDLSAAIKKVQVGSSLTQQQLTDAVILALKTLTLKAA